MRKYITIFAALASLASCQKEDVKSVQYAEDKLAINMDLELLSKATDTAFESGDNVGVYVVNNNASVAGTLVSSGNHYDNVKFTKTSDGWNASEPMWWLDKTTPATFYAYHPYGTPADVNVYEFAVAQNQTTIAAYKASDFVWGKTEPIAPTASAINISTNHIFSNMLIKVVPGDGFTQASLDASEVTVNVKNLKTLAVVNLADGSVTASGAGKTVLPLKENGYWRAVVVPQTVPVGSQLIGVSVNGVEYILSKGVTFKPGNRHTFTVKVNKTGQGINIGIGGWTEDSEDLGGSAE